MDPEPDPITDEELLYRRVPQANDWYLPIKGLSPKAFAPHREHDLTGLSVSRAKYKSIEDAAKGRPGKSYYVGILRARDLRKRGIVIEPRPLPDDPAHAELPQLNSANRKEDHTAELQELLVALCSDVRGPFYTPEQAT